MHVPTGLQTLSMLTLIAPLQAAELRRLALYFDVGTELWAERQRDWGTLPLDAWDAVFRPGITGTAPAPGVDEEDEGAQTGAAGLRYGCTVVEAAAAELPGIKSGNCKSPRDGR